MNRVEWTDARLNDLVERLDKSIERLDLGLTELRREIAALRTELRAEIAELRTELKGEIAAVRRDGAVATVAIVAAIVGTGVLT